MDAAPRFLYFSPMDAGARKTGGGVTAGPWPAPRWASDAVRFRFGPTGRGRCAAGWSTGPTWWRRLRDFDLWLVWAGRGTMRLSGDRTVTLRPGVGFWMRPGGVYVGEHDPANPLGITYLHFEADWDGRPVPPSALPPDQIEWNDLACVDAVTRRIVRLREEADPEAEVVAQTLLRGLLQDYVRQTAGVGAAGGNAPYARRAGGVPAELERAVWRLVTRVRDQPGAGWTVRRMAREAGLGPSYFRTVLAAVTGQSPRQLLIGERMARARFLLDETDLPVGRVAAELGYRDPAYFSRQFAREAGVPPRAWRRREG